MKAIQVRYLSATATRGSRLKIWCEGIKSESCVIDYDVDPDVQAEAYARWFAREKWQSELKGFGTLPNGDWVGVV